MAQSPGDAAADGEWKTRSQTEADRYLMLEREADIIELTTDIGQNDPDSGSQVARLHIKYMFQTLDQELATVKTAKSLEQ